MTAKSTNNSGVSPGRSAIMPGSFNPFTVGHASVLERALEIFDHIFVVIGVNAEKPSADAEARASQIRELYNNDPRISVLVWNGLMADLARKENVRFFVRGVRGIADFEYELHLADVNRRIAGIETVFLPALPEHSCVSSSIVRELNHYGVDVTEMLPKRH